MTTPPPVSWHVLAPQIRRRTQIAPGGLGLTEIWTIPYVIDSGPAKGHHGDVQVPEEDYTPESVQQAIQDQVDTTHSIGSLRG
jgi:hypothetical protein